MNKGLNIWHVGNWCIHTGNEYIESPFLSAKKNVEVLNYGLPIVNAMKAIEGAEVISQPSWELYNMSPEDFDKRLAWASTIVFGDVETKCMMLHPDFFNRMKWESDYVTFPDRFNLLLEWIQGGGHFHMNGGWYSFSGQMGKGGWGRSLFRDAFPINCIDGDDLVESTESFPVRSTLQDHPILEGIDLEEFPPLLGFNQTTARSDSDTILEIQYWNEWFPLLAQRALGSGRITAWTTGASPHWGINLIKWKQYNQFWRQLFNPENK